MYFMVCIKNIVIGFMHKAPTLVLNQMEMQFSSVLGEAASLWFCQISSDPLLRGAKIFSSLSGIVDLVYILFHK